MAKRFFLLIIFVGIAVTFLFNIMNTEKPGDPVRTGERKGKFSPMGVGTHDDPYARYTYERERLIDPGTGQIPDNIRSKELSFVKNLPSKGDNKRSSVWQGRGPYNVGGKTRAVALDVNDENIILAGGVTGGMWRSANGGQSYIKTTTPDQLHSVTCVAQDRRPGKTETWYYGTGEYYGVISAASFSNRASGNGIFKSTNGGTSWQLLSSTASNTPATLYANGDFDFVWNIVIDHKDLVNDVVYAAVVNGIYKSKDGGQTWYPALGLDSNDTNLSEYTNIVISPAGVLYAAISSGGSAKGLFRSMDGETWTDITPAGWPPVFNRVVMAVAPSDENKVYFLAERLVNFESVHYLWHYTYLSGDGSGSGGLWDNRTANLPDFNCQEFYDFTFGTYSSQNSYCMAIAVKPDDENSVFLGGIDVHRSTDGFTSKANQAWIGGYQCDYAQPSNYIYPNHHPDLHDFLFLPSNSNVLITASDGGVHKTLDCLADSVRWISMNNGYLTSQFYTVAIENGKVSNDFMVGGMQDNGTFFTNSGDPQKDWSHVFYGDGAYCAITQGRDVYYLSWQTGKTFKFEIDDNGDVLGKTRIDPAKITNDRLYRFINPFILNPADENVMYLAAGSYLWRNNGLSAIPVINEEYVGTDLNWEQLIVSSTGGSTFNPSNISCLGMSMENANIIYYGTTDGKVFKLDSLAGNPVKTNLTSVDFPPGAYVSCVAANQENANEVMISFSNYNVQSIYHSTDGGNTWHAVSGNLEENPDGTGNGPSVTWVEYLNLGDSVIYYAGTSVGLFSATKLDGYATLWTQEGANSIGNVVINMIKTRSHDGLVAVATHGNGIYSARHKDITSVYNPVSANMVLSQNHPNPFTQTTRINIQIAQKGMVKLTVYAVDGREIRKLVNDIQPAGSFSVEWDGMDYSGIRCPTGMYIYQLHVGEFGIAKKLILAY